MKKASDPFTMKAAADSDDDPKNKNSRATSTSRQPRSQQRFILSSLVDRITLLKRMGVADRAHEERPETRQGENADGGKGTPEGDQKD